MENIDHSGTTRSYAAPNHVVTFRLGNDTFALPIEPVGQILPMLAITPLPEGAGSLVDSLVGAFNLHGRVVPVIDLRRHVRLSCTDLERDTPLIVAHAVDQAIGLIVDEVLDVLAVDEADVTPPGDVLPQGMGHAPVLAGLVRLPEMTAGRFALLLDIDHLFAPEQREALERAVELLHEQAATAQAGEQ